MTPYIRKARTNSHGAGFSLGYRTARPHCLRALLGSLVERYDHPDQTNRLPHFREPKSVSIGRGFDLPKALVHVLAILILKVASWGFSSETS